MATQPEPAKPQTNLEEALEYDGGVEIIPFNSLEPRWTVPGATEGGFLRYLTSWVGGPEGHINPNLGMGAIVSQEASVGYMKLMTGCRQKGIHAHTIVEIYIILRGEIEGFDGTNEKHTAGPMDCVYIPKGVPHGVRNSGTEDLDLLWIHDGIEKKGLSTYYFDGDAPKIGGVSVIKFNTLEPHWGAPKAKEAPFLRYAISYVGGKDGFVNLNPNEAALNDKTGLGMMVIYPGNGQVLHSLPGSQCYVICQGTAIITTKGQKGASKELGRLDGIWVPKGTVHAIRNPGHELLWVMWSHEVPVKADAVKYHLEG